ncbi:MAG: hypothetical protein LLF94_08135 [Chlamydiales bacterium]|nr:hypothetical protein [Chlamydiales bacterium]
MDYRLVAQEKIADPRFHSVLAELAVGGIDGNRIFDCEDLYSRLLFHLLPEHELKKLLFSHDAIVREQLFEDELQQLEVAISRLSVDGLANTINTLPKQNELRPEVVEETFAGVGLQAGWNSVYNASKKFYAATIDLNNILSPCETLESAIKVDGIAHGAVFAIAHIDMVKRVPQEGAEVSNYSLDILKRLQTLRQKEGGPPLVRVLRGIKKNGKLVYKSQNTPDQVACQLQGEVASCAFSSILAWLTGTFHDITPFMHHMLEERATHLSQHLSQSVVYYHHPICRFGWSDDLPILRRLLIGAVGTLSDRLIVPIPISYVKSAHDKAIHLLVGGCH